MYNLLFSILVLFVWGFRKTIDPLVRKGRIREGFCALWFITCIFSLCGTILSFHLYQYQLQTIFSLRNLFFSFLYIAVSIGIFLLAPAGLQLFTKKSTPSEEEMLLCEYHFHETADHICRFFQFLLFGLPILLALLDNFRMRLPHALFLLTELMVYHEIYGGFCFFAFLILLPLSLRQAFYWLIRLKTPSTADEQSIQRIYSARHRYKKRNRIL